MADRYVIVSLKWTRSVDENITFWRPNNAGYCYALDAAGRYSYDEVVGDLDYYNNGDSTLAILHSDITELAECLEPGYLPKEFVVRNTEKNWLTILSCAPYPPRSKPKPRYQRCRKCDNTVRAAAALGGEGE